MLGLPKDVDEKPGGTHRGRRLADVSRLGQNISYRTGETGGAHAIYHNRVITGPGQSFSSMLDAANRAGAAVLRIGKLRPQHLGRP